MQRAVLLRTLRFATIRSPSIRTLNILSTTRPSRAQYIRSASHAAPNLVRWISATPTADERIEEITELYATAQDEFEIAMEETEKVSVYAEEDRKAAREELTRVQEAYKRALDGPDEQVAQEVKRRIGQRIRELEHGVAAMEEMALNQD